MRRRPIRASMSWVIGSLVALQALAAPADPSTGAAQTGRATSDAAETKPALSLVDRPAGTAQASVATTKKSRLQFRTSDGTCACTCASGGIGEAAIQLAQESRERASR